MDEAAGHTRRRCERSLRAAAGLVVVVVVMIPVFLLQAYNFHTISDQEFDMLQEFEIPDFLS